MKTSIRKQFSFYVFQNIVGMLGLSAYILADTYFISKCSGTDGIAMLNLILPVYTLIFAIGQLIASGSAIAYKISKSKKETGADFYFGNALLFSLIVSIPFVLAGAFTPEKILQLFGADEGLTILGKGYTKIFTVFAPSFMWNYCFSGFVRNDNDPTRAMVATFSSSIFNIIMDYILIFPVGMGIQGAALATAISPILGILINSTHFFSKNNALRIQTQPGYFLATLKACRLGISAFIGELSGGITMLAFNFTLIKLSGNTAVAAYGVIANIGIICIAIFNGIAQGAQPLCSAAYAKNEKENLKQILKYSFLLSFLCSLLMVVSGFLFPNAMAELFNSEHNAHMVRLAVPGIKIYFIGLIFAGFNIVAIGYLCSIEAALEAMVLSLSRGVIAIVGFCFLLSSLFGIMGVWAAFPAAELLTFLLFLILVLKKKSNHNKHTDSNQNL